MLEEILKLIDKIEEQDFLKDADYHYNKFLSTLDSLTIYDLDERKRFVRKIQKYLNENDNDFVKTQRLEKEWNTLEDFKEYFFDLIQKHKVNRVNDASCKINHAIEKAINAQNQEQLNLYSYRYKVNHKKHNDEIFQELDDDAGLHKDFKKKFNDKIAESNKKLSGQIPQLKTSLTEKKAQINKLKENIEEQQLDIDIEKSPSKLEELNTKLSTLEESIKTPKNISESSIAFLEYKQLEIQLKELIQEKGQEYQEKLAEKQEMDAKDKAAQKIIDDIFDKETDTQSFNEAIMAIKNRDPMTSVTHENTAFASSTDGLKEIVGYDKYIALIKNKDTALGALAAKAQEAIKGMIDGMNENLAALENVSLEGCSEKLQQEKEKKAEELKEKYKKQISKIYENLGLHQQIVIQSCVGDSVTVEGIKLKEKDELSDIAKEILTNVSNISFEASALHAAESMAKAVDEAIKEKTPEKMVELITIIENNHTRHISDIFKADDPYLKEIMFNEMESKLPFDKEVIRDLEKLEQKISEIISWKNFNC